MDPRVVYQAAQIAPVVDRMGRMLTDLAPHLNQIVKSHNQRIREQGGESNRNTGEIDNIMSNNRENTQRRLNGILSSPFESILNLIRSNGRESSSENNSEPRT